jgi:gas vesicle protein
MYELQQSSTDMSRGVRSGKSFAVGALVGVGLALLLAPATGRDVRRGIGQTARRVGSGAMNVIGRARETVNGVKKDAQNAMERGREEFAQTRRPGDRADWHAPTI